jgi:serine/threonine protein kinase
VSTSDSTRIGTEIAGYRVESLLGRGGMSVVYLAEHVRLGRRVALKLLAPMLSDDETYRDRFQRESRRAAELDHPNVVPIYDAGEVDGQLFIAMRYIEGCDLKTLIRREGTLGMGRTLFILEQVADGLDAAHERNLIHRDVKPANILIAEPSEQVYLTDFGVVKHTASKGLTRTGFFIGTVDYAAPEQIEGLPVDARTDVYALGCVLYECLVGKAPFDRDGDAEINVMHAHLINPPPLLTASRPDLPKALNRVLASALAKSKDDRYDTCGQLIEATRVAARQRSTTTFHSDREDAAGAEAPAAASGEISTIQPPTPALSSAEAAVVAAPVTVDSGANALPVRAEAPPVQPAGSPPQPPASGDSGGGRPRDGRAWLAAGAIVVAALLAAVAVYAFTRDSNSSATPPPTTGTITTSPTLKGDYKTLQSLIPGPIRRHCIFGPTESHPGNLATANCPYTDAKHGVLSRLHVDLFADPRSALQIYIHHAVPGLQASGLTVDFKSPAGRCNGTELRGEGTWSHDMGMANAPVAGRVACYIDPKTGEPTIIWTYPAERLFVLASGPSHGQLYAWWRFWAHEF